jgi:hypothetical protein
MMPTHEQTVPRDAWEALEWGGSPQRSPFERGDGWRYLLLPGNLEPAVEQAVAATDVARLWRGLSQACFAREQTPDLLRWLTSHYRDGPHGDLDLDAGRVVRHVHATLRVGLARALAAQQPSMALLEQLVLAAYDWSGVSRGECPPGGGSGP